MPLGLAQSEPDGTSGAMSWSTFQPNESSTPPLSDTLYSYTVTPSSAVTVNVPTTPPVSPLTSTSLDAVDPPSESTLVTLVSNVIVAPLSEATALTTMVSSLLPSR